MKKLDAFFEEIAAKVVSCLEEGMHHSSTRHWVIVDDDQGVDIVEALPGGPPPHELLQSLLASGATAAAYATHVPEGRERVVAEALVIDPSDSDTRVATVLRDGDQRVRLGPWEGPTS